MTRWIVVVIVAAVAGNADAAEPGRPWTIDLRLKSEAPVPAHLLEQSRADVARIFADAGLAVRWTEIAPRFTVRIVARVLGFDRAASPAMGAVVRTADGSTVQVFFKQVQDFARAYDVDLGMMLAYVIAHEIGHLLLPGTAHSSTGLMQAEWGKAAVRDAARGSLTFTEAQAATIRARH